jgi:hypothetical protein
MGKKCGNFLTIPHKLPYRSLELYDNIWVVTKHLKLKNWSINNV